MTKKEQPFFSIVIPTLDEEKYLPLLLSDLVDQDFSSFEVLVVDAQSTDGTQRVARSYSTKLPLTFLSSSLKNASAQRNLGAEHAQGSWLLFMDADNRLPTYFLSGVKYQLAKQKNTDVFTTLLEVHEVETVYKTLEQALNLGLILIKILDKPSAYGALIGCKRDIIKTVKFDEGLTFSEDGQFVNDCYKAGFHFTLFREPRFIYSMRRLKAEGTFNTIKISLPLLIRYTLGDDLHGVKSYVMQGGKYYDQLLNKEKFALATVKKYIQAASKKQLKKARAILSSVRDFDL